MAATHISHQLDPIREIGDNLFAKGLICGWQYIIAVFALITEVATAAARKSIAQLFLDFQDVAGTDAGFGQARSTKPKWQQGQALCREYKGKD